MEERLELTGSTIMEIRCREMRSILAIANTSPKYCLGHAFSAVQMGDRKRQHQQRLDFLARRTHEPRSGTDAIEASVAKSRMGRQEQC